MLDYNGHLVRHHDDCLVVTLPIDDSFVHLTHPLVGILLSLAHIRAK